MNFFLLIIICLKFISNNPLIAKLRKLQQDDYLDDLSPRKFNSSNTLNLYFLYDQFNQYFNQTMDKVAKQCWNSLFKYMVEDYDYKSLYFYSGHKLSDIGDPVTCVNENYTYLLALLTYDINETSSKIEDKISLFTSKEKSNLGICIWEECNNYINQVLIKDIDKGLKKNLNKIYHIKDIKVIMNNKKIKEEKYIYSLGIKILGMIVLLYFLIFVILKLIVMCTDKHQKAVEAKIFELRTGKKIKKDYLKEEANVIKEEDNEDDNSDEEDEEEDEKEDKDKSKSRNKSRNNKNKSKSSNKIKNNIIDIDNDKEEEEEKEEKEEEEEEEEEDDDNDDSKISHDSLFKKEIEQSKIRYIERNLNKMNNINLDLEYSLDDDKYEKKDNLINDYRKKKAQLSGCYAKMNNFNQSFLSLISIHSITQYNNNQIYTNKGLEMITGLRTFVLMLITFNISFRLFEESPSLRQMHSVFIRNFLFGVVKYSSFGMYFWVYLDGLVYTFKLMNYVKQDKSFKTFLKFSINLLPKILSFLMIFYGVYFFQKEVGIFSGSTIVFDQYIENEYNYKCLKNPLYLLFPFINPITSSNNKMINNYYNNCYQFSYLVINEFYCIILFIIMFYFLYKYQSKILDLIITLLILINILVMNFLPYFFEDVKNEKYYLLKYVLGETFSLRYPHNMFNIFFLGIFSGLIYYYHYFSVNDINSFLQEDYLPFQYLSNLMQLMFKCNWILKSFLILLSLGIIFVDCLIYFIIQKEVKNGNILFEFSGILKILYLYETPIIILSTSILLIVLLLAEDKMQIKSFLGSKIFYIMEKISFNYICLIQMISLLFLSSSINHGEIWSYLFFFYIMFFEFAFGTFVSFLFTLAFELPAKVLANYLRGKKMDNKKK